jgi:ADP-dependent NAD(P)H-hydrate dehydratase / NAD(P)H-hydrate epimerase
MPVAHDAAGILRSSAADLPLLSAAEMEAWDAAAQREGGIPGRVLMESAGRAAAAVIDRAHPRGAVVVVVGKGNNGGDGVVAARTLRARGREVSLWAPAGSPDQALLHGWGVRLLADAAEAELACANAAVLVDALLGTGASGAPRGALAEAVDLLNAADRPVVALDGPSGVDLTSGEVREPAVRAGLTITFGAPKRGLLLHPGRELAGRVVAVEIGLPPQGAGGRGAPGARLVTPAWAAARLPALPSNAHKGTRGTVGILAGSEGMAGAAHLSGRGALRAGAGKVRIASHPANREILQQGLPEALYEGVRDGRLPQTLLECDAVVAGPGLGRDDWARRLIGELLDGYRGPLLLDADALVILAEDGEPWSRLRGHRALLTPHPKEMSALLGAGVEEITADPFGAAEEAARRYGCAVLLKGSPSVVAAEGRPLLVPLTGHSGVAAGGMGDVLSGIAGAFMGQGVGPGEAGALALHYGGIAAELAGRGRSLLPGDLADALPGALEWSAPGSSLALPEIVLDLLPRR